MIRISYQDQPISICGRDEDYEYELIKSTGRFNDLDILEQISFLTLPDGLIIDIGSGIGNHTIFFSRIMKREVMAFEPDRNLFDILKQNIEDNHLGHLVQLYDLGVSDDFYWRDATSEQDATLKPAALSKKLDTDLSVRSFIPLDRVPLSGKPVAFIKINVGHGGIPVLRGSHATIHKYRPGISIELRTSESLQEVLEILRPYNYRCLGIFGNAPNYIFLNAEKFQIDSDIINIRRRRYISERLVIGSNNFELIANEMDRLRTYNMTLSSNYYNLGKRIEQLNLEKAAHIKALDFAQRTYGKLRKRAEILVQSETSEFPDEKVFGKQLMQLSTEVPKVPLSSVVTKTRFPYFIYSRPRDRRVRIGIATIPSRIKSLWVVIDSLYSQADEIFVSLNGFDSIPDHDYRGDKVTFELNHNIGDFAKFKFLTDEFDGYYLTCDDDIKYPPYYVDSILYYIQEYDGGAIVGWHGSVFKDNFSDYYDSKSRHVMTFGSDQHTSQLVHVLGTGCAGFDTRRVRPPYDIFKKPSMADLFLADYARANVLPMVLVPHDQREAVDLTFMRDDTSSISGDSIRQVDSSFNVRAEVNRLVKSRMPWGLPSSTLRGRILFIGRIDHARWSKGGIYRSCHLMIRQIESLGYQVTAIDVESPLMEYNFVGSDDFLAGFVYAGDQRSQDSFSVEALCQITSRWNFPVYFNLSYDNSEARNLHIEQTLRSLSPKDGMFVFTEAAKGIWSRKSDRPIVVVPKTISPPGNLPSRETFPDFSNTDGVFMGDVSKFLNTDITPDAERIFETVASLVERKKIIFVKQYKSTSVPEYMAGVNLIEHSGSLFDEIRKCRVFVHAQRFCTFEMLPVEAMFHGVPVIYVDMPQSLNEYIGNAGAPFVTPNDLSNKLNLILNDRAIWDQLRENGLNRAQALTIDRTRPVLEFAIASAAACRR